MLVAVVVVVVVWYVKGPAHAGEKKGGAQLHHRWREAIKPGLDWNLDSGLDWTMDCTLDWIGPGVIYFCPPWRMLSSFPVMGTCLSSQQAIVRASYRSDVSL